jgi:hypothetical protein
MTQFTLDDRGRLRACSRLPSFLDFIDLEDPGSRRMPAASVGMLIDGRGRDERERTRERDGRQAARRACRGAKKRKKGEASEVRGSLIGC